MTAATLSVSEVRCLQVAINIMDKYMQIARGEIDGYDPLEPCPMPIDLSFDNVPIPEDTPSAWIPVTERLPDDNVTVLAAFDTRDGIDYGCAWHYSDEQGWRCWDDMVCNSGPIVAWMPIPEYEVSDEETD